MLAKLFWMTLLLIAMVGGSVQADTSDPTVTDEANTPAPHFMGHRGPRGPLSIEEVESRTTDRFTSLDADEDGFLALE